MGLDFSKLENIAYRGFEEAEARAEKDNLIEQGFTVVEAPELPFKAAEAQPLNISALPAQSPLKRQLKPFTGMDKKRNYRAMYRAACDFHERHNPPRVDAEYWKSHTPGIDEPPEAELQYWEEAANDICEVSNAGGNDPFLMGLLVAVYEELEREFKAIQKAASERQKPPENAI